MAPSKLSLAVLLISGLSACAGGPRMASSGAVAAAAAASSATGAEPGPSAPAHAASAPPLAAAVPASGASAPTPVTIAPPGGPPPFATVIKGAKKSEGVFTVWQKDERVWMELKPEDFGKPLFLDPKIMSGLGEPALYGGLPSFGIGGAGGVQLVEFKRLYNVVQLVARNTDFIAAPGTPEARAVAAAFSPSLVGSTPVVSQPHPTTKAILIDVTGIFVSDMLGVGTTLQRAFRQNYGLDGRNSAITAVRDKPELLVFEVQNHYATASLGLPQPGLPPGVPQPSQPRYVPDARSLIVNLHYSLSRLPEQPMAPRRADPRVGYFDNVVQDYGSDLARNPKLRHISRWRLEKKDPAAELSEPVKPITFWLDRTIPLQYRGAITEGVLAWNAAFERIGFKGALVVKQQPDDADWDTLDSDRASIRWMTNASPRFGAIGPSQVDPRSGEILDADIALESLSSRTRRADRAQILSGGPALSIANLADAHAGDPGVPHRSLRELASCSYADEAAQQLDYALDVLEARGEVDPDSPEAQQFVLDYLKDTTMHEVGHTLGLRHNFRASHAYTDAQVSDLDFTRAHGTAASVMDYTPVNLARAGEKGGTPFQLALGPYDYWAVEYGYKPLPADQEVTGLAAIASRSATDPQLVYGTDEDNFLGIDPDSLHFDLGDDPVAFAKRRFDIARELLRRQEQRDLKTTENYTVLRRAIAYALLDAGRAAGVLARQIGGVRTLRDYPGSGHDPLQPTPAPAQRAALDVLSRGLLAEGSLTVSPALLRRLAPDYLERGDALGNGDLVATDYPVDEIVFEIQRAVLNQLMSDGVATRVLDSEAKAMPGQGAFRLSELYQRLTQDIWSELGKSDISASRRELQRDHVSRLAAAVLRPGALSRADARSLNRSQAQALQERITTALKRGGGLNAETRAHLQDSAEVLSLALSAKVVRTAN